MIIGIYGLKGGGKTVFMTLLLWIEHIVFKKIVYSNYKLKFKYKKLDMQKLAELDTQLQNTAIGIDELHMIADSRRAGAKQNLLVSYFVLQSRHRSVNLYFTSQFEHQVDRRVRENTDIKIIAENLNIDSDGDGKPDLFRIIIQDNRGMEKKFHEKIICGTKIYDQFDTNFIINLFQYKEKEKKPKKEEKKSKKKPKKKK